VQLDDRPVRRKSKAYWASITLTAFLSVLALLGSFPMGNYLSFPLPIVLAPLLLLVPLLARTMQLPADVAGGIAVGIGVGYGLLLGSFVWFFLQMSPD